MSVLGSLVSNYKGRIKAGSIIKSPFTPKKADQSATSPFYTAGYEPEVFNITSISNRVSSLGPIMRPEVGGIKVLPIFESILPLLAFLDHSYIWYLAFRVVVQ